MDGIMKNIRKAEVLTLKEQIAYQEGQVVSRTLAQNSAVSVTLFSFDKGRRSVPMNPAVTLSWSAWTARAGSRLTARSICCMRGIHCHARGTPPCRLWNGEIQDAVGGCVLKAQDPMEDRPRPKDWLRPGRKIPCQGNTGMG